MEIRAQDLRIGNWVIDHLGSHYKIKASSIVAQLQYELAEQVGYRPIPLTEEILLKCGFDESIVRGWDYTIRLSALHLRARKSCGNIYFELEDIYFGDTNLKYLHQLQNFFHSITGQEINVKL